MSAALNDITISNHAAVGYFVDQKKGEVNELKTLLKSVNSDRDIRRKREVIKKVIAYMTLGIDVSRLFTDMVMAIETKDIVIKKMVYFYLCNYAHAEPEMAIMCINSLRRDCDNENPLVRGLALRSLCSLRLESILEYVEQPLQKSLRDISAYVRKTGVMGVLKIYYLSPATVEANRYVEQLEGMLQDQDANVVTNVIYVLNELRLADGGLEATQGTIMALLNRIGEFSEWGLNTVLDLVARYRPASEDEIYAIMNLLDPVLRTANSGSVLATLKCFFHLTKAMPDLAPQIIGRSKPPLLTLITGANPEVQYMTLKHLESILYQPNAQVIFEGEYRQFFVRYNEPPHVKHLKVDLLPLIACPTNAREIAAELGEYVTDVDSELAKRAIRALGEIALRVETVSEEMTSTLLQIMEMDSSYVRSETAIVLANVMRVHPRLSDLVLPHLAKYLRKVDESHAKAALVWMLGEFGHNVLEAPYILEQIVDKYNEEESTEIKLQVLTASMKLFMQRPPEMQRTLGRLLSRALNDSGNQDLHDRALLYYRLLSTDINAANGIVSAGPACSSVVGCFAEDKDLEMKIKLFQEFNTLAVVFKMPSTQFVQEKYRLVPKEYDGQFFQVASAHTTTEEHQQQQAHHVEADPMMQPAHLTAPAVVGSVNLLDWEDHAAPAVHAQPPAAPVVPQLSLEDFRPDAVTPTMFQKLWAESTEVSKGSLCHLESNLAECAQLERVLSSHRIFTMASGALPDRSGFKLFVYCTEEGHRARLLAQLIVNSTSGDVTATVKIDAGGVQRAALFVNHLRSALLSFR